MKRCYLLLIPAIALLLAADDAAKNEIAKLKGNWAVVEMQAPSGEKAPDEVIKEERPPLARDAHFNQYTHSKALGEALALFERAPQTA